MIDKGQGSYAADNGNQGQSTTRRIVRGGMHAPFLKPDSLAIMLATGSTKRRGALARHGPSCVP
eukprot:6900284-Prorocentrum_lima.AAC.1